MKRCPRCSQTYTDNELNFCLNDGELLTSFSTDPPPTIFGGSNPTASEEPATVFMDKTRATNPTNWPAGGPVAPWQQQQTPILNQPFSFGFPRGADQTLATISLVLGIISLVAVCCYGGIWLGIPAAGVGFVALRNINSNPTQYGGRGLAIAGIVMGIITAIFTTIHIIIIIIAMVAGQ
jgi:hypothetical protein